MWYFAYGSDLSQDSIMDWSKSIGQFVPPRGEPRPAVLVNHRLCFPAFEEFWRGGVADAVPAPGKSVGGALFKVTASTLRLLDQMAGRKQNEHGTERGTRQRQLLEVKPYNSNTTIQANVYRLLESEQLHVPPTEVYLKRLANAAWQIGLSATWIMHLRSFASQACWSKPAARADLTASARTMEIGVLKDGFRPMRQSEISRLLKPHFPRLGAGKLKERRASVVPIHC